MLLSFITAAVSASVAQFADGALLAASVYLVSRGAANVQRK